MRKYVDGFFSFGMKVTNFFKIGLILEAGLTAAKEKYDQFFPVKNEMTDVRHNQDAGDNSGGEIVNP